MRNKTKSSYQKLKEENQKLKEDIRILVHRDTPWIEKVEKEAWYRILFDGYDMAFYGTPTISKA